MVKQVARSSCSDIKYNFSYILYTHICTLCTHEFIYIRNVTFMREHTECLCQMGQTQRAITPLKPGLRDIKLQPAPCAILFFALRRAASPSLRAFGPLPHLLENFQWCCFRYAGDHPLRGSISAGRPCPQSLQFLSGLHFFAFGVAKCWRHCAQCTNEIKFGVGLSWAAQTQIHGVGQ